MKNVTKERGIQEAEPVKNSNNMPQKKYLQRQKQLRVWMENEKFDKLKKLASEKGTSIHRLIHNFVDAYIESKGNLNI